MFLFLFSIFPRRCPLLATFLSVLFCLLSLLISDSRFDLVWLRLSCNHGWIRSGSVNVRKTTTDRHYDGKNHGSEGSDGLEDQQLPYRGAHSKGHKVQVDLRVIGHEVEERHELVLVHQRHEREDRAEARHQEHHLDGAQVLFIDSCGVMREGLACARYNVLSVTCRCKFGLKKKSHVPFFS